MYRKVNKKYKGSWYKAQCMLFRRSSEITTLADKSRSNINGSCKTMLVQNTIKYVSTKMADNVVCISLRIDLPKTKAQRHSKNRKTKNERQINGRKQKPPVRSTTVKLTTIRSTTENESRPPDQQPSD